MKIKVPASAGTYLIVVRVVRQGNFFFPFHLYVTGKKKSDIFFEKILRRFSMAFDPDQLLQCSRRWSNMTLKERLRVDEIIRELADRQGVSPAQIRREIQECIDDAWANKTRESAAAWLEYFPDGRKPSVEKFIVTLGKRIRNELPN